MKLNNVNLDNLKQFEDKLREDSSNARKTQVITGEWNPGDNKIQFQSNVEYEGGKTTFEVDNPTFMG